MATLANPLNTQIHTHTVYHFRRPYTVFHLFCPNLNQVLILTYNNLWSLNLPLGTFKNLNLVPTVTGGPHRLGCSQIKVPHGHKSKNCAPHSWMDRKSVLVFAWLLFTDPLKTEGTPAAFIFQWKPCVCSTHQYLHVSLPRRVSLPLVCVCVFASTRPVLLVQLSLSRFH